MDDCFAPFQMLPTWVPVLFKVSVATNPISDSPSFLTCIILPMTTVETSGYLPLLFNLPSEMP